jgi:hypothetical protein
MAERRDKRHIQSLAAKRFIERKNKRKMQSLSTAGTSGQLTAQEVNNEWCDIDGIGGDKIYLKLTNLMGGSQGETALKWLDYSDSQYTMTWSTEPTYSWFITPSTQGGDVNSGNRSYLLRADNTKPPSKDTWDQWKSGLCQLPSGGNSCTDTSNTSSCSIGHKQSDHDYWKQPQLYCSASGGKYADDSCVKIDSSAKKSKSWWGRSPYTNGKRGPSFCNAVADVSQMKDHGKHTYSFFLDGRTDYPQSSPVPGGDSESQCKGCTRDGGPCPSNGGTDLIQGGCPGNNQVKHASNKCQYGWGYTGTDQTNAYSTWISDNTAAACCSMSAQDASKNDMCKFSVNPGAAGSKCSTLMADYCVNNWNSCALVQKDEGDSDDEEICASDPGQACNSYLATSASTESARQVISSYINDQIRQPSDFISWALKERADDIRKTDPTYTNPSWEYYNTANNGGPCSNPPPYTPDNPGPYLFPGDDPNNVDYCLRDDSYDPFFATTIPYLCAIQGTCDPLLGYFCQEFDRGRVDAFFYLTLHSKQWMLFHTQNLPRLGLVILTKDMIVLLVQMLIYVVGGTLRE